MDLFTHQMQPKLQRIRSGPTNSLSERQDSHSVVPEPELKPSCNGLVGCVLSITSPHFHDVCMIVCFRLHSLSYIEFNRHAQQRMNLTDVLQACLKSLLASVVAVNL